MKGVTYRNRCKFRKPERGIDGLHVEYDLSLSKQAVEDAQVPLYPFCGCTSDLVCGITSPRDTIIRDGSRTWRNRPKTSQLLGPSIEWPESVADRPE